MNIHRRSFLGSLVVLPAVAPVLTVVTGTAETIRVPALPGRGLWRLRDLRFDTRYLGPEYKSSHYILSSADADMIDRRNCGYPSVRDAKTLFGLPVSVDPLSTDSVLVWERQS